MGARNLSWAHWTVVVVIGTFALPALLVPALLVLPFLLPLFFALPATAAYARA